MKNQRSSCPEVFQDKFKRSSLLFNVDVTMLHRLMCPLCSQIMMMPVQSRCGCRFCYDCIHGFITERGSTCPNCNEEDIEETGLIRDKAVEREIFSLDVRCPNVDCNETMSMKKLTEHIQACDYRMERCDKCQQQYGRAKMHQHVTEECVESVIVCEDCGEEMTRGDLVDTHKNTERGGENLCEKWFGDCPYKCDEDASVVIKSHLNDCRNRPTKCPLEEFGCAVRGPRAVIEEHVEKDGGGHQILMMREMKRLTDDNCALSVSMRDREEEMRAECARLKGICSENDETVRTLTERLERARSRIDSLSRDLESQGQSRGGGASPANGDVVTNNGTATWTIRDIRRRIHESRSGDNDQIVSDSFYVLRPGYCMSMKIYLNGDGRARDRCLSSFFVLNKGDYDNEITWPFRSKVTLSLLSSDQRKADIVVHMRPDRNEACYGRPTGTFNVAAGQPEFVRLSEILNDDHYLHRGALKLRLSVSSF